MVSQQPTPEEKLFAVIQGAAQKPLRARAPSLSLTHMGARLAAVIGPMDLPLINRALTGLAGGMAGLCMLHWLMMRPHVERIVTQAQRQLSSFTIAAPLAGLNDLEDSLQLVSQHDPFRIEAKAPAAPPTTSPASISAQVAERLRADLKLVGISLSPEPVAMIEQVSGKQTYVLKPGEMLGSATLKEVLPDRVILRVGDQDVELF